MAGTSQTNTLGGLVTVIGSNGRAARSGEDRGRRGAAGSAVTLRLADRAVPDARQRRKLVDHPRGAVIRVS